MHRRSLLAALGSGFTLALAGCTGGDGTSETTTASPPDTATPGPEPTVTTTTTAGSPYGTWFRNTDNFDGTVDRTGEPVTRQRPTARTTTRG